MANIMKTRIAIQGMTCQHCQMTVQKGLSSLKGVSSVEVHLKENNAEVGYDPDQITVPDLKAKIVALGYKA
ncbi:MAG: heavy-metal-associated domain-containing protein [Candidatus Tectomicrobia bacterium]|uniref:Heavy-metal-associated domain-containing protein n=1 Tax=Tectimicrobiota bacterium TaxID=2528274 RepID=A0A933GM45_UNCTE|nr:heavy-metal-associated domain-containing protein [Candidatus Tectomicrobia bacterium]